MDNIEKRYTYIIVLIAVSIVTAFFSRDLFFEKGLLGSIPYLLIFICIPYLLFKVLSTYNLPTLISLIIIFLVIFINTAIFLRNKNTIPKMELGSDAVKTRGIVVHRNHDNGSFGHKSLVNATPHWLVVAVFEVDGIRYETFPQIDQYDRFEVGDTVRILYSPGNPNINKINFGN